jgi:hypothetical protein
MTRRRFFLVFFLLLLSVSLAHSQEAKSTEPAANAADASLKPIDVKSLTIGKPMQVLHDQPASPPTVIDEDFLPKNNRWPMNSAEIESLSPLHNPLYPWALRGGAVTWNQPYGAICWSPDDSRIFLPYKALVTRDGRFITGGGIWISPSGKDKREETETPRWVEEYWKAKTALTSPTGAEIELKGKRAILSGKTIGDSPYPYGSFSWSPPGMRAVVFSHDGIFVMSEDGKVKKKIRSRNELSSYSSPAWSNDGKKIAYQWCTLGGLYVYVVELSGPDVN